MGGRRWPARSATDKIKKKTVKKIANKQINKRLPLGTEDIADNAIDAAKVVDGSLGTAEFSHSIPAVRATRTTDQALQFMSNNATTLIFDSEHYDTAAMHDDATNNSRLTAPVDGIYAITAQVVWSASTTGDFRSLTVRKNNGVSIARAMLPPAASGTLPMEVSTEIRLQAGDYVEASVFFDAGGVSILKQPDSSPEFSMTWLAPGP